MSKVKYRPRYEIKIIAIIQSRFKRVLFLDTDNFPLRDPTFMFNEMQTCGYNAVLWPDMWETAQGRNFLEDIFDVPVPPTTDVRLSLQYETGQMLFDKEKSWEALHVIYFMNMNHDYFFRFVQGDKETYYIGFIVANLTYHLVQQRPLIAGFVKASGDFQGTTMVQFNPFNMSEPLFYHSNSLKWRLYRSPWQLMCRPVGAYLPTMENKYLQFRGDVEYIHTDQDSSDRLVKQEYNKMRAKYVFRQALYMINIQL
jgi:alpha 1,2-mannosyltransferase